MSWLTSKDISQLISTLYNIKFDFNIKKLREEQKKTEKEERWVSGVGAFTGSLA